MIVMEINTKTVQELEQEKKAKSAKLISVLCWILCIATQATAFYFAKETYHISLFLLCPALLVCPAIMKRMDSRIRPMKHVIFIGAVYFITLSCATIFYTLVDNHAKIDYAGIAQEYAESVKQNAQSQHTQSTKSPESTSASSEILQSNRSSENSNTSTSSESKDNSLSSSLPSVTTVSSDTSQLIYATPNGKRYHYKSSCAGINALEISRNDISKRGLTPCGTCAKKDILSDQ